MRTFNRFYTSRIGVLRAGLLESPFSLTQARVLYELAHRRRPTATEMGHDLGLDPGYLSRILAAFRKRGLVSRTASKSDGREGLLGLTAASWALRPASRRAPSRARRRRAGRRPRARAPPRTARSFATAGRPAAS